MWKAATLILPQKTCFKHCLFECIHIFCLTFALLKSHYIGDMKFLFVPCSTMIVMNLYLESINVLVPTINYSATYIS